MSRKTAIITGGSSGIGAASALELAKAGCNILVTYASNKKGGENIAEVCRTEGVEAIAVQADVSSNDDCITVNKAAVDKWGRVDILVNSAGMTRFLSSAALSAIDADDFARIYEVNVTGTCQMIRAVEEEIIKAKGSIVNISSHAGKSGLGSSMVYASSKAALNTLTLSLARHFAPNVRVNAVCPGFVGTDWMAPRFEPEQFEKFKETVASLAPLKTLVLAEDVAEAVLWFALGGTKITGQQLTIDGGTHLTTATPVKND